MYTIHHLLVLIHAESGYIRFDPMLPTEIDDLFQMLRGTVKRADKFQITKYQIVVCQLDGLGLRDKDDEAVSPGDIESISLSRQWVGRNEHSCRHYQSAIQLRTSRGRHDVGSLTINSIPAFIIVWTKLDNLLHGFLRRRLGRVETQIRGQLELLN